MQNKKKQKTEKSNEPILISRCYRPTDGQTGGRIDRDEFMETSGKDGGSKTPIFTGPFDGTGVFCNTPVYCGIKSDTEVALMFVLNFGKFP